jgi:hypothetical protein
MPSTRKVTRHAQAAPTRKMDAAMSSMAAIRETQGDMPMVLLDGMGRPVR